MIDKFRVNEDGEIERFAFMAGGWSAFIGPESAWALAQAIDRDRANLKEPLSREFKSLGRPVVATIVDAQLVLRSAVMPKSWIHDLLDWLNAHMEAGTFGGES